MSFEQLNLGGSIEQPSLIAGGCSHQLYQLKTDQGVFAVKVLNPAVVNFLGGSGIYRKRHEFVCTLPSQISAVKHLDLTDQYIVYPWVEGTMFESAVNISDSQTKIIGALLANIHATSIKSADLGDAPWQCLPKMDWALLGKLNIPENDLKKLHDYVDRFQSAWANLDEKKVLSHGDLNHWNVLWGESQFYVLDWESLGFSFSRPELLNTALSWSGFVPDAFRPELFQSMISAYEKQSGQAIQFTQADKDAALGYWLIWLKFCAMRALKILPCSDQDAADYNKKLFSTIKFLERFDSFSPPSSRRRPGSRE